MYRCGSEVRKQQLPKWADMAMEMNVGKKSKVVYILLFYFDVLNSMLSAFSENMGNLNQETAEP